MYRTPSEELRKVSTRRLTNRYTRYQPGRQGLFYGLAKVHKIADLLGEDGNPIDSPSASTALPLRPVISNIGTATYELSRHLAKLLKPLTKSGFALESSKEFVELLRSQTLPPGFKLVSFDVVSLFTKVPLDYTIEVILRKIYDEHLITTKIPQGKMSISFSTVKRTNRLMVSPWDRHWDPS